MANIIGTSLSGNFTPDFGLHVRADFNFDDHNGDANEQQQEKRMTRFAIGLLMLAMYATPVVVVPMVTPAKAVTNSKEIKKKKKVTQMSLGIRNRRPDNPFPPMDEDPDRKAAGGGY